MTKTPQPKYGWHGQTAVEPSFCIGAQVTLKTATHTGTVKPDERGTIVDGPKCTGFTAASAYAAPVWVVDFPNYYNMYCFETNIELVK